MKMVATAVVTAVVGIFLALGLAHADNIYVSAKGARLGQFKGELPSPPKGFENKIPGSKFHYEVISPRDPATGLPMGKRQHRPVTITKEWGAASPQFFQALISNETLTEVIIDFVTPDAKQPGMASGGIILSHTIKLTNATVSNISYSTEPLPTGGLRLLEDVSFTFQKIELIDVKGNGMAMDTWAALQ
jgi:type VI secretion system secreted protein Hcp